MGLHPIQCSCVQLPEAFPHQVQSLCWSVDSTGKTALVEADTFFRAQRDEENQIGSPLEADGDAKDERRGHHWILMPVETSTQFRLAGSLIRAHYANGPRLIDRCLNGGQARGIS